MLYPKQNEIRELNVLDGLWKFRADSEKIGIEQNWFHGLEDFINIAVPGSWNDQYENLHDYFGYGWYEKEVFIPNSWFDKHIWIRVGSACFNAVVWVNGQKVCEHIGGHLPFCAQISKFVKKGELNRITILVDGSLDVWCLPPASMKTGEEREGFFNSNPAVTYDFYPYIGIHRSVMLFTVNEVYIDDVTIKTALDGTVDYSIQLNKDADYKVTVTTDGMTNTHNNSCVGRIKVNSPKIWSIGCGNLYDMKINVYRGDVMVDTYTQRYGIRTVEIRENRLLLNNEEVFLKGFGKHEDFFILGKGFNANLMVKDFDLLNWIGANSFRTSHYPYAEEIMDYADEKGILVIDETPFVGLNERMYTDEILDKALKVIKELIARDKNHPCVIMWSLANEPNANTKVADNFFESMVKTARSIDDTRPITYVVHQDAKDNSPLKFFDVVCVNKYYGWYLGPGEIDGTLRDFEACLDDFYHTFKKPIILTEFGADAIAGMHALPAEMFSEEFQAEMLVKQYRTVKKLPYCIGAHVWAFADFKTAQSISRVIFNRKGVFTRDRQPKMAAHELKKEWNM